MNIVSTQYTLSTKSIEIYLSGCSGEPKCKGCHNPELWDFNIGENWKDKISDILTKCEEFSNVVNNIMIFGGEPLDNDRQELIDLLFTLNNDTILDVWLFTRYELDKISEDIKHLCNYIKCGRYDEKLLTDDNIQYGIKLATSNQKIYKKGIDYE